MIKTTVVIPNYNGIKYMEDCLTFLSRCKETEFATIVVDNGSSDGSRELVAEKFPWVELIANEENLGFCKAVNQGIRASRTPYVLLLNNDTVVDDRFVANLEKSMDARPGYFSISAKMLSMKEPEIIDDAGDFYCALGWAFARGKGMDGIQSRQRFLPPAAVQRSIGGMCLQRSAILMKTILRIWRISISVIVQGYLGIRTAIARMRSFTMREAAQADRDTTRSRWISPPATVFICSIKICRFCS